MGVNDLSASAGALTGLMASPPPATRHYTPLGLSEGEGGSRLERRIGRHGKSILQNSRPAPHIDAREGLMATANAIRADGWRGYLRASLVHLLGREGYANLQTRRWTVIGIVAPILGLVSDIMQVLGPWAWWAFCFATVVFALSLVLILLRTRFCERSVFPCVLGLIGVLVFGAVVAVQSIAKAEDKGVAATVSPVFADFRKAIFSRFDRVEDKIDTAEARAEARHQEALAAIARDKGVEPRFLEPLFAAAQMDRTIPRGQEEAYIRAAVDALKAKGLEKLTPSNLGAEIDAALREARARLAKADAQGALAVLDARLAQEAEERQHRQRGEALLHFEKAGILQTAFRHGEAVIALKQATQLASDVPVYWWALGDIAMTHGSLGEARSAYQGAMSASEAAGDERSVSVSHFKIGDVLVTQGNLAGALGAFRAGLAIAERLAGAAPVNSSSQRDLSVSHIKIGEVLVSQGDLLGALDAFRIGHAIFERLAQTDPANAAWQRDLSVSHTRIGDVLAAQGDRPGARVAFRASLAIRERLAQSDPANTGWQRDLAESQNRIGDVLRDHGDMLGSLNAFKAGLSINERLTQVDPLNSHWWSALNVSYDRLGDLQTKIGNLEDALETFRNSLNVSNYLVKTEPSNVVWNRDLSVSYEKIGNIRLQNGNFSEALVSIRASHKIRQNLAQVDASNSIWQRDLIFSHVKLASIGETPAVHFKAAHEIAARLQREGRLAPRDAWMVEETKRLWREAEGKGE
jgi:tetratricopeptide (TPR) repeat protein